MWLTTTPIPPGLADTSWQSFCAGIISSNGWSPLNNPMFTQTETNKSQSNEKVIGFPTYGTALAYQKLYGTPDGARVLAETTANLVSESFYAGLGGGGAPVEGAVTSANLVSDTLHAALAGGGAPVEGEMTSVVRLLFLKNIAPYSYRQINALAQAIKQLASGASGGGKALTFAPGTKAGTPGPKDTLDLEGMTDTELRAALSDFTVGDIISSFVASLMIAVALQGIISESFMLVNKIELRGKLATELDKQRSAPLPDLSNLFFYDKPVVIGAANLIAPDPDGDYQPTDPVELERLMGTQEAYRAFLLATL
jgi:hypothetical protein